MNVENTLKRILFEILFVILLPIGMIWLMLTGVILLIIESFKVFPGQIYEITKIIVYGQKDS
jgi:hypothetical protein